MKQRPSRRSQRGYLLEVPLLLAVVAIVLAIVLPTLPKEGAKVALCIAAVPVLLGLRYMILTPGWTPGNRASIGPILRWALFLPLAGAIITGCVMLLLSLVRPMLPQTGQGIALAAASLLILAAFRYAVFTPGLVPDGQGRRRAILRWSLSILLTLACLAVVFL